MGRDTKIAYAWSVARKLEQTASPARNFTLTTAERVSAIVTGLPAWARRRKFIEELYASIPELHHAGRLREATKQLDELCHLIDTHNTYYPMEANLPLDQETSRLMEGGTPWKPMPRPTLESVLAAAEPQEEPSSLAWSDMPSALSVAFAAHGHRYKLTLTGESISCGKHSVPTRDIEEIRIADGFLEVLTVDTQTIRFHFELEQALLEIIVSELSTRLREIRAATSDYRGGSSF